MNEFNSKTRDINIYEIYNGDGSELFGTGKRPEVYEAINGIEAVPIDDSMSLGATYGDYTPWVFNDLNSINARRSLGGESATSYLTRQDARDALHIPSKIQSWSMCSRISFPYSEKGSIWAWEELRGQGYKMLKF